jgi:transcriptional regulator with GAF, ATPase, and Fis domain
MGSPIHCANFAGDGAAIESVIRRLDGLGFPASATDGKAEFAVAFVRDADEAVLRKIQDLARRVPVVAILSAAADDTSDSRWSLLDAGAADILDWADEASLAERIVARFVRWTEIERLVESDLLNRNLVGDSSTWRTLKRKLIEAAVYSSGNILLVGETGTGKEQIAKAIHQLDLRTGKPDLAIVDCTTLSPELSGSELFGHERGAFTGAVNARDGAFALANGGTLLLDEVGELPLPLQAQLLRVIQERTYKRVGGNVWHRTEFRLICATNRDLAQLVRDGGFRGDLYYRIADWVFRPPPLRERRADILPLARHFLTAVKNGAAPQLDRHLANYLISRDYPGNVRDLRGLVMRLRSRHVGSGPITIGALPVEDRPRAGRPAEPFGEPGFLLAIQRAFDSGIGLKEIGRAATDAAIGLSLEQEGGSLQRAARRLGITDRALQMRRAGEGRRPQRVMPAARPETPEHD